MSRPFLGLLTRALKLWLQSQCDHLDSLELELTGSGRMLLQGHLEGAHLEARGVAIASLAIGHAVVTSGPIRVNLAQLRSQQHQNLLSACDLRLRLWFSPDDLRKTLLPADGSGAGFALLEHFQGIHGDQCRCWSITTEAGETGTARVVFRPPATEATPATLGQQPVPPLPVTLGVARQGIHVATSQFSTPPTTIPLDPAFTLRGLASDATGLVLWGEAVLQP